MKPITNKEFNDICNIVYPIAEYINELGDSYQDLGHSCILINFLSKRIIENFLLNIEVEIHFGDVWYILNSPYKLKWGINENKYRSEGIGHCFLIINKKGEQEKYYIDFTSFLFNSSIANIIQDKNFNHIPKKIFQKKIIEKQKENNPININLKEGDYFYEIETRHIEEKNKNLNDYEYIPTIDLFRWYKSQAKEIILEYRGKKTKLYLGNNNVSKHW